MPFILLLGGARSGKSALALAIAERSGSPVTLVATAEALDEEMAERIARHREQRPATWTAIEEPIRLVEAVRGAPDRDLLVVDCLTLWVSNCLSRGRDDRSIGATAAEVASWLTLRQAGAVVVSNEVGLGIIPVNPLARAYRDTLGRVNAMFAAQAERSVFMVAGRVHELSSTADFMEGIQWHPH